MGGMYKNIQCVKKSVKECGRVICGVCLTTIFCLFAIILITYTFHLVLDDIIQKFHNFDSKKSNAKSAVGDVTISS